MHDQISYWALGCLSVWTSKNALLYIWQAKAFITSEYMKDQI